jgi:hypothetical protein
LAYAFKGTLIAKPSKRRAQAYFRDGLGAFIRHKKRPWEILWIAGLVFSCKKATVGRRSNAGALAEFELGYQSGSEKTSTQDLGNKGRFSPLLEEAQKT